MLQPLCGYVLDVLGLKLRLRDLRDRLVAHQHGARRWPHNWQTLAGLRGLLGLAEGSANPAGMKATAEWFPARERGLAGGVYNIGASVGSMLAPPLVAWAILSYNWQTAFVITGGARPRLGGVVALALPVARPPPGALDPRSAQLIAAGQEAHLRGDGPRPSMLQHRAPAQLLGHRPPALPGRPDLGHADLLGAALPEPGAGLRPEADRALRLDAVPGRGRRLPVRRRDRDCGCRSAASRSSTRGAGPSPSARC